MHFYQLVQILPDIASALGTSHCAGLFFMHQDAASWTKPSPPDVIACLGKAELFRFFSFAYET
jgi:hypothetical protein